MSDQPFQPYQPQPYGRPYPALPQPHPQGTAVLVLGILGFFVTLCAPFAWYLGSKALKEIQASGARYSNEDQIRVGRVLGMIITILAIIGLVFAVIFLIIAAIAATTSR
jgi:hypothetical protein